MKQRQLLMGGSAALGMLLLILDSRTALSGASEGINLCIRTVIPSLFPFFVLSGILLNSLMGKELGLLRPLGSLLGLPEGTQSLLISAFLGGYPVGAKAVADAWKKGHLKKEDAQRLLSFCSNAGPAFLFGMAAPAFSIPAAGWLLWINQLLSAITVGILFRESPLSGSSLPENAESTLSDTVKNAVHVTAQVCGWVVLFRIVNAFLERWFLWLLPPWGQVLVSGILELTNGCVALTDIPSEKLRFILCCGILSFGGICVLMQTLSVTKGLHPVSYVVGKLLQTFFSILYAVSFSENMPVILIIPLLILIYRKKNAKRGGNPRPGVV